MKIENEKLSLNQEVISSADSIISLTSDIHCVIFGVLELSNGVKKIIQFIRENEESNLYRARLVISESDFSLLDSSTFYLELHNGELSQKTNVVQLEFDKEKIKLNLKKQIANEFKEILTNLKKLDERVTALTTGKVLQSIAISNKNNIQQGMIPVAIDDKGNFVAMYPFADLISSINGQHGVDGAIKIDAAMIEYKIEKTIKQALDDHAEAIVSVKQLVDQVIENQNELRDRVDEIDVRLETHINNGII